ncbi:MAG: hypothetical protein RM347_004550 [Nostoc sp. ChiQUE02]|uniref:hypothetical protein n=1 Tax=Nostoc sp. ChiQUE02 TaxID=3075377 RepID=UPI002AD2032B|nr:hypothetical protein [Nostoc sp. ChiQUE02]
MDAYSYGEASYAVRLVEKRLAAGYHRGAEKPLHCVAGVFPFVATGATLREERNA